MAPFSAIWRVVGRVRDILTLSPSSPRSAPGETPRAPVDEPARATTVARRTTLTAGPVKVAKMAKMTLKWLAGRPTTPAVRERVTNAAGAQVAVPRFQPKTLAKSWTVAVFRSIQSKVRIYSQPVALPPASPSHVHAPTISEDPITPADLTSASPSNGTAGAGADRTLTSETDDITPPLTASSSFDVAVPPSPSLRGRRTPVSLSLIAQPRATISLDITTPDSEYDLRESGVSHKFGVSMDQSVKGTLGHEFAPIGFLPSDGALSGSFGDNAPEDIDVVIVDREANEPWLDKPVNTPPRSAQTGQVDDDEFRYEGADGMGYPEDPQTPPEDGNLELRREFDAQSNMAQVEDWVLADLEQAAQSLDETMPVPSLSEDSIPQPPAMGAEPLAATPDSTDPEPMADEPEPEEEEEVAELPMLPLSNLLAQLDAAEEPLPAEPATPSPKPTNEIPTNPSSSSSSPITSASATPSVAPSISDSSSPGRPRFQGIQSLVERRISQVQSRTSPSASPSPAPAGRDAFRRAVLQIHTLRNFSSPRAPPPPAPASINPESMRKATTRSMRKFGDIVEQERKAVEDMKASLAAIKDANKSKLSGGKDVTPPSSTKLSAVPSLPPVLEHEPLQKVRSPVHRQVQLIAREVSEEPKKVGKPEATPPRKSQSMNSLSQPPEDKHATELFPALPSTSMLLAETTKTEAATSQNANLPSPFTEPDNISPEPSPPPQPRQRQLSNGSPMNLFQRQMLEIAKEGGTNLNAGKENGIPPTTGEVENVAPAPRSRRRRASNNTASTSSNASPSRQSPPSYASVATSKPMPSQPAPPSRNSTRGPSRRAATLSEQRPPRSQQQQGQQQQAYPRPGPNPTYKQATAGYPNGSNYSQHAPGQNYAPPMNGYAAPGPQRSYTGRSNPPPYSSPSAEYPTRNQPFNQRPGQAQQPSSRPNSYSQPPQPQRSQTVRNRRPRQATFAA